MCSSTTTQSSPFPSSSTTDAGNEVGSSNTVVESESGGDGSTTTVAAAGVTNGIQPQSQSQSQPQAIQYDIYVKPLLVLDLNGILCHRYRRHDVPVAIRYALDQHHKKQQAAEAEENQQQQPIKNNVDATTANGKTKIETADVSISNKTTDGITNTNETADATTTTPAKVNSKETVDTYATETATTKANTNETTEETTTTNLATTTIHDTNGTKTIPPPPPKEIIQAAHLYRIPIFNIASTPIISRPNLDSFLQMLDQSFTLAIWTSAKQKTAKGLVENLVPPDIRARLLFVWGQDRCQSISSWKMQQQLHVAKTGSSSSSSQQIQRRNEGDRRQRSVIFRKPLSKVWEAFPLWNKQNTLMMDDSPDKCPEKYSGNTLHPPPLSGLNDSALDWIRKGHALLDLESFDANGSGGSTHTTTGGEESVLSYLDETNIERQDAFFRKLVIDWKSTADDSLGFLASYLPEFGTGHMGWRAGSIKN